MSLCQISTNESGLLWICLGLVLEVMTVMEVMEAMEAMTNARLVEIQVTLKISLGGAMADSTGGGVEHSHWSRSLRCCVLIGGTK